MTATPSLPPELLTTALPASGLLPAAGPPAGTPANAPGGPATAGFQGLFTALQAPAATPPAAGSTPAAMPLPAAIRAAATSRADALRATPDTATDPAATAEDLLPAGGELPPAGSPLPLALPLPVAPGAPVTASGAAPTTALPADPAVTTASGSGSAPGPAAATPAPEAALQADPAAAGLAQPDLPAAESARASEPAPDARTEAGTTAADRTALATERPAATTTTTTTAFQDTLEPLLQSMRQAAGSLDAAPAGTTPIAALGGGERPLMLAPASDMPVERLPALEPQGNREAFAQGLGERLMMLADKGLQSATIRLQPEHLGPMEIRIHIDEDGAARVNFSAHHAQTREALESTLPRLREMLSEQGLSLQQASVDAGRGGFASRGWTLPERPALPAWAQPEDTPATPPPSAWSHHRIGGRRLDVLA